jgi:Alginate lyase
LRPVAEARLAAGIYGSKLAEAAELCAYAKGASWANRERAQGMFNNVFYPLIANFSQEQTPNGNWDAAALSAVMAIAVFSDDRPMFERSLGYWRAGVGNGSIEHYIINADGQCQESGRDQPHTIGGIGHLVEAAAVAWNQGTDLFGYGNNRLLAGLEYTAKYNLGNSVPFTPNCDVYKISCFSVISASGRGSFSPIWEMAYQSYKRKGVPAPYTQQVRDARGYAPETYNNDHPGIGTLTFTE